MSILTVQFELVASAALEQVHSGLIKSASASGKHCRHEGSTQFAHDAAVNFQNTSCR